MKTITEYLKTTEVRALAQATRDNYENSLKSFNKFLKRHEGIIFEIDAEFLEKYTKYLVRNKSGATIRQYVTIVKLYLKWAGEPVEFTYRVPATERKRQQMKEIERWFTEADISRCMLFEFPTLKEPARSRNKLIVRLLAETGARVAEIANIEAKDFDEGNRMVFLRYSKTEPRPAFYSVRTAEVLAQHKVERVISGEIWRGQIFPTTDTVKKAVAKMLKDLGMKNGSDGRGPHTFRHYVATYLYFEGGMALEDVAIVLGDKPDTIRETYLHPSPFMLQRKFKRAMGW